MSLWRSLRMGLRSLVARRAVEQDIDDELRHYLELATIENQRRGMSPAAAERAARLAMGGVAAASTRARWMGWEANVESVLQDIRVGWRGLLHARAFTVIAVLSLALGIGATTAMFSVLNAVIFRPLPYRDADQLAVIWTNDTRRALPREATAYLTIADWQTQARTFEGIAYFATRRSSPLSDDAALGRGRARIAAVSANLFGVLGVPALHGRTLTAQDEQERAPVAVISHRFWHRWYGGAPDVIGRQLRFDEPPKEGTGPLTIIGILPPDFYFPDRLTDIFTPATTYWRYDRESGERFVQWARRWTAIGRVAPGRSIDDARAELRQIGSRLASLHKTSVPDFPGFDVTVVPVLDTIAGTSTRSILWILLGAVGVVLLVVCSNVANLMLARGARRQREFAIRRAVGASRGRIARQLLSESLLIVAIGGTIGTAIAVWATPLIAAGAADYLPRMDQVALDFRVLLFASAITVLSGFIFGFVPALRFSATDANETLREGGHGTRTLRLRRSQGLLVLAESALALVLLTGAGLLLRSFERLHAVNPGFDPDGVITMRFEFSSAASPTLDGISESVRAIPGVASVGFVDDMFVTGQGNRSIVLPGRAPDEIPPGELNEGLVTPEFFHVMRVPLVRGRYPTREDAVRKQQALRSPQVGSRLSLVQKAQIGIAEPVVVNEAFVHRYFRDEDPIGKRFCIDPENKTYWYEIVGVVGDMHRQGLHRTTIPEYFGPYLPRPNGRVDLVVRTNGDPLQLAPSVRAALVRALPSVLILDVATADAGLGQFNAQRRLQTGLLTLFASLALVLAAIGIFGLAHYTVSQRTREIGVRVALGATPADVLRLIVVQGMQMPVLGIAVGIAASLAVTRIISSQLFGIGATDPATFSGVALGLAIVALCACLVAARGAIHTDPVRALRD